MAVATWTRSSLKYPAVLYTGYIVSMTRCYGECFLGLVLLCGLSMILYTNWQWAKERAEITEED